MHRLPSRPGSAHRLLKRSRLFLTALIWHLPGASSANSEGSFSDFSRQFFDNLCLFILTPKTGSRRPGRHLKILIEAVGFKVTDYGPVGSHGDPIRGRKCDFRTQDLCFVKTEATCCVETENMCCFGRLDMCCVETEDMCCVWKPDMCCAETEDMWFWSSLV